MFQDVTFGIVRGYSLGKVHIIFYSQTSKGPRHPIPLGLRGSCHLFTFFSASKLSAIIEKICKIMTAKFTFGELKIFTCLFVKQVEMKARYFLLSLNYVYVNVVYICNYIS